MNGRTSLEFASLSIQSSGHFHISSQISTSYSNITNYGFLDVTNGGFISRDTSSLIQNLGTITTKSSPSWMLIPIQNSKLVDFGNCTVVMGSYSSLRNAQLTSTGTLNVTTLIIPNGNMNLGGELNGNLDFNSTDGTLRFVSALTVRGNLSLQSTIFFSLTGGRISNFVTVHGHASLTGLFLLLLENYNPFIGDNIDFVQVDSSDGKPIVYLLGAPFKNADMISSPNGNLAFKITASFGSVSAQEYQCHYMGDQKIIEWNRLQNKIMLSFTTPARSGRIGFGFDQMGSFNDSLLVLFDGKSTIQQYVHENASQNGMDPLVIAATTSSTFFGSWRKNYIIGTLYTTINILVPQDYLTRQQIFYYGEIPENLTGAHYQRSYDFKISSTSPVHCTNLLQPTRLETFELTVYIAYLIVYAVLFVLCILLGRSRPLNTRGISPALTTFILFVQLLLEVRNYTEIPPFQGSLCFYYAFSIYPLQVLLYLMLVYYTLRYFSIIHINQIKNSISRTKGYQPSKLQAVISKLLKFVSLPLFRFVATFVTFLIIVIVFFIVLAADSFVCKFDTLIALKTVQNVELAILYLLTLIILVVDVIINWKLIVTFKWIQYILFNDPYWFRAQYLLLVPFMIFSLVVEFAALITSTNYKSIAENFGLNITLNTIQASLLFILVVIIPVFIAIVNLIYKLIRGKKKKPSELDNMIKDPVVSEMMLKFCRKEFSLENYLCYKEILEFKENPTNPLPIYFKYFNGINSIMEVNVAKKDCQVIFDKIKNQEFDATLFKDVERTVLSNISDTWSRFQFEADYQEYLRGKVVTRELIEGK